MKRLLIVFGCLALWIPGLGMASRASDWKPVDPAHLSLKTPVVDPGADAEAIFWELKLEGSPGSGNPENIIHNYIRIKIFTERGRQAGEVDLIFGNNARIKDIAGRTIKPDGTMVELKKDAISERTLVKPGDIKVRAKTFTMPAVEPGCIIEYRWTEYRDIHFYVPLELQGKLPVQQLTLRVKPISVPGYDYRMRVQMFNGALPPFQEDKGFYVARFDRIPGFREEPLMPPDSEVKRWILLYYTEDLKLEPGKFWKETGRRAFEKNKDRMKVTDEIRAAAMAAIGDASTPDQKLERLFNFCRKKVRNAFGPGVNLTSEEIKKLRDVKQAGETLRRGHGTNEQIDLLFAALAAAAGFDARLARITDRSQSFFESSFPDDYFLKNFVVAVQVGSEWRFFDPGFPGSSFRMLPWQEEGLPALIPDPQGARFVVTPISRAETSMTGRTGNFAIDAAGTMTGTIKFEYTGHTAQSWRNLLEGETAQKQEEVISRNVQSLLRASVSEITVSNLLESDKPLVVTCRIVAPDYAKRSGKQLVVPVSVFEQGAKPLFGDTGRTQDIYLRYGWAENDNLTISVPEGFELENTNDQRSYNLPGGYGRYETKLQCDPAARALVYHRAFWFGNPGELMRYPSSAYPILRAAFKEVHQQDGHTVAFNAK